MALKHLPNLLLVSVLLLTTYMQVTGFPKEILILLKLNRSTCILKTPRTELKPVISQGNDEKSVGHEMSDFMRSREENLAIGIRNKRGKTMLFNMIDYVGMKNSKPGEKAPIIASSVPREKIKDSLRDTMAYNGK